MLIFNLLLLRLLLQMLNTINYIRNQMILVSIIIPLKQNDLNVFQFVPFTRFSVMVSESEDRLMQINARFFLSLNFEYPYVLYIILTKNLFGVSVNTQNTAMAVGFGTYMSFRLKTARRCTFKQTPVDLPAGYVDVFKSVW